MSSPPVTLWSNDLHRCVLYRTGRHFELVLIIEGRVMHRQTFVDENAARERCQDWVRGMGLNVDG